ncbi:RDD family protein [Sporosarcina sp. BI001-red]|uniref:RDD family protein n=1 Tax=Sporosarcina sp. BI001-red TaxID=2282866 RepID=UPI000E236A14|nr:RDD family protein [Sporosarcina sp. BI001-red]REB10975.1 RDD family protein [Sporosarcina sp. BI001-red]
MNEERIGIKTPEFVTLQFQLAGLGSRSAAFIIDQLILMVFNISVLIVLAFLFTRDIGFLSFTGMESLILGLAILGLFIVNTGYFVIMEYFSGGKTIGKKIIGIRAIQENGHSLTLLSSFIRNLLRIIDSLPGGYFLGIVLIFFHSKHKRIGDLVAGTIVVHERQTKRQNKRTPIEKEIAMKQLTKEDLVIEEWALRSIVQQDWKLLETYSNRLTQLSENERNGLTEKVANLLLPKFGLEVSGKSNLELENTLLVLYLILREEWSYEL